MPKISITAVNANVQIQDDFPAEGALVMDVQSGETRHYEISWGQLQRVEDQLSAFELKGFLTYVVTSSTLDPRAQEGDLEGLPLIDYLSANEVSTASGVTGVVMEGVNLLGDATFAETNVGDTTDVDASLRVRALIPGVDANAYSVVVVDSAGGGLAVTVSTNQIEVDLGGATSTAEAVRDAINAESTAKLMVLAAFYSTGDGSANFTQLQADTSLTGGTGSGVIVTCAGEDATITAIDETTGAITWSIGAITAAALASAMVALRSNGKLSSVTMTVTA